MSTTGDTAPMEEEAMPPCDSQSNAMDWAKEADGVTIAAEDTASGDAMDLDEGGSKGVSHESSPPPPATATTSDPSKTLHVTPDGRATDSVAAESLKSPFSPPTTSMAPDLPNKMKGASPGTTARGNDSTAMEMPKSPSSLPNAAPVTDSPATAADPDSSNALDTTAALETQPTDDEYSFGSNETESDCEGENEPGCTTLDTAFDMSLLSSSIEFSKDALDLVRGKEVVMIVGKSGVGKSTLIQGIAGKQIHASFHRTSFSGQTATKAVFDAQDALPNFEIGHAKKSKTNCLNAFSREHRGREVVYLDSPGLEDTRGVEMDIATSALLSQVAKRCKSLRFVVLIHCASLLEDRGNAIRSIVHFARRFVRDFSESKQSFMFLFTHTNEIAGMGSNSEAKERLVQEIIQIAGATSDQDIIRVLEFLRKSLKKGYPFADTLHPLETDYIALASTIEGKIRDLSDLASASNCNLTLSSKLKLDGAVKNLLDRLQLALASTSQDNINEVKKIQHTFSYLRDYVEVDCVHKAAFQSRELLSDHKKALKQNIESDVIRMTNSSTDFNMGDAFLLQDNLLRLQDFDDDFSVEGWIQSRSCNLTKLQDQILEKAAQCKEFHRDLKKMQAWKDVFKEHAVIFSQCCQKVTALIQDAAQIISKTDLSTVHQLTEAEVSVFIEKIMMLYAIREFSDELAVPEIDMEQALLAQENVLKGLISVITSYASTTAELTESKAIHFGDDLKDVVLMTGFLLSTKAILAKNEVGISTLDNVIGSTISSLESDVISLFTSCCDDFKGSSFDPSCEPKLIWMRELVEGFSNIQDGHWGELRSLYSSVVDKIKTSLNTQSGELLNMSEVTKEHGMRSGERLGHDFVMFSKFRWFDFYLPDGDGFVANCCIAINHAFQERIRGKSSELAQIATSLGADGYSSAEAVETLALLLPELEEIDKFTAIVKPRSQSEDVLVDLTGNNKTAALVKKCFNHLEDHSHKLFEASKKCTSKWIGKMEAEEFGAISKMARRLDFIHADTKALSNIREMAEESKEIVDIITTGCRKVSSLVDSKLNCFQGDFKKIADLLSSIKDWGNLLHIGKNLPDYKDAQHKVRDLIAREAQKIENEIAESSDWEKIDINIDIFESAVVLDSFVSQEVTARLNTIRRLRERKEGEVNEHVEEMISSNNFKGLSDFLSPLAGCKDQIKKQRYESFMDTIKFQLNLKINDVQRCLDQSSMVEEETLSRVAQSMRVLADAKAELRKLLRGKLNISSCIGQLSVKIDQQLKPIVGQIFESLERKDYVQATLNYHHATAFMEHLEEYIKTPSKNRLRDAKKKYRRDLNGVPNLADQFRQLTSANVDLQKSLASLQKAKENKDDARMTPLASIYDKTRNALIDIVRDFFSTAQEIVAVAPCYDEVIPTCLSLNRQLSGPLKAHFPADIPLECENLLERLQKEQKAQDDQLEFGGKDVMQVIELWEDRLDKLKSPSWHRRLFLFGDRDRASYKIQQRKLTKTVDGRFNQACDSLTSGDFRTVQECIEFLSLVEKKLLSHVPRVETCLLRLKTNSMTSFLEHCRQIKTSLKKQDLSRFEEKFSDYRGYVLCIQCILASKDGGREFALINQMVYEIFDTQIKNLLSFMDAEELDFSQLRSQILGLRKSGDFFADRVTVLNEEMKQIKVKDCWLGKVQDICSQHFGSNRDFGKLKYCITLGVAPSASVPMIRKAFKLKAKQYHPDKMKGCKDSGDSGSMFRKIKEAESELLSSDHLKTQPQPRAFDEILKGIDGKLRVLAKTLMEEQRYGTAEKLLFQLASLKGLDDLTSPKLKSKNTKECVNEIIKGHVEKMRVDVDTSWSERRYKDLNNSISVLKNMESHFKSYPEIFTTSWNTGIIKDIETEIELLRQKAKFCLSSYITAKKREGDFRRFFIEMGTVLVELPSFKVFTKHVMNNMLESCLDTAWGYSFLFELGLSLQKGDDAADDNTKRVAQMLVSEFTHFKEVLTMVWNEEVSQKPVEDVVELVTGEEWSGSANSRKMDIDHQELLKSYQTYDKQYKSLLGEYIKPEADLNALVQKMTKLAKKLLPVSCDKVWLEKEKQSIPILLAGVFALFTVLQSGASFNRIEAACEGSSLGEKLLMKPHNIQVLTLLHMFGCGKGSKSSIDSQLMQIRTGEGKSIILGAAAVMFALLGFSVRTVCYSEYLSTRDFRLFEDVFQRFGLLDDIKYSKITVFAEDSTASKGDIRGLTETLLRGDLSSDIGSKDIDGKRSKSQEFSSDIETRSKKRKTRAKLNDSDNATSSQTTLAKDNAADLDTALDIPVEVGLGAKEEILLVDEVDVFFGSEFYGRTYNQVIEFKEPEVATILKRIWESHISGHRLRLGNIKGMSEYKSLARKLATFGFLLDNEIALMLNQVKRVKDVPYYLDAENDRIGYKVMDSISYNVTFGYSTIFAYLNESDRLKDKASALDRALVMPISCGQFSYANISPARIVGVSGTLQAIGQYEKDVLASYGLNKFIYVPSVYGDSNFHFDKAGEGILFEANKSNFFHKISSEIKSATKSKSKRAVIVFFRDRSKLNEFINSPTYRQLARHKSLLTEDMSSVEKEYVISKAATSGQITLSTAVFGRGTDFFCKDEGVEKNGGVHIIQTFLSEEVSEEVQVQGRTARQGKRGSYQMILLTSDLESDFGVEASEKDKVPKNQWYQWLCDARLRRHKEQCLVVEKNLEDATEKDKVTHQYFDSLLARQQAKAKEQFKELYQSIKKPPVPSSVSIDLALVIDITGSMSPYAQSVAATAKSLVSGKNALTSKLSHNFPEIEFQLKIGCLGFRDIDDGPQQFTEMSLNDGSHFTKCASTALDSVNAVCAVPSGGFDLAEDIVGAINHCSLNWQHDSDWASDIKFMMLFSDAAAHGLSSTPCGSASNADSYSDRHPGGLTIDQAVTGLLAKDIDLFFCSFNPSATAKTEDELSKSFESNPDNGSEHVVARIPMVPNDVCVGHEEGMSRGHGRHIVFVLDESGSMSSYWSGVVSAYNQYLSKRRQSQSDSDLVSVVQFDSSSRASVRRQSLSMAPNDLSYSGGGTAFYPAAQAACKLARETPASHAPAIIFMSDGQARDANHAAAEFSALNAEIFRKTRNDLELHVVAFGYGTDQAQLQHIAGASRVGKVHSSSNTTELASVFVNIATNQNVSLLLETEVAKRISEAVSDKLSLEYFGS